MHPRPRDYPFRSVLSFRPLIEFWRKNVAADPEYGTCMTEGLQGKLEKAPELLEPIEDLSVLDGHQGLLRGPFEHDLSSGFVGERTGGRIHPFQPPADPRFAFVSASALE